MRLSALLRLIGRDLGRARGALVTSGFGIAAGTAALCFFLALGLGVREVLLGEIFPIDKVELEPPKTKDPGLVMGMLFGKPPPGIPPDKIRKLQQSPDVAAVYPKLRFAFPMSARGGKELLGREVGSSEMIGDGIDPALVRGDVIGEHPFEDPLKKPGKKCRKDHECEPPRYCEGPAQSDGVCSEPVPVLVSRYLVEIFNKSVAPAHNLPPIGESLVKRAQGVTFKLWLGESLLGKAKQGKGPRHATVRVVGISPRAIDLGITVPLDVVRRWNQEYTGAKAAEEYSSVLIQVKSNDKVSAVIAEGAKLELLPKDTRARDVSVLITSVMALLALVAAIILLVSASNIAYTFRVFVNERRSEIALYRAIGASAGDMFRWLIGLALTVGAVGGSIGVLFAYALSLVTDNLAATRLPDFPFKPETFFAFPPWLVLGALGFASLFALLGAVGPARRAGKVQPAIALAAL